MEEQLSLPTHLGFIVDGNRRWARERGLPTLEGHTKGFNQVEEVAKACVERGIKYTSFYLFSTENWQRSQAEVDHLMKLLLQNIKRLSKNFLKNDIRILVMGRSDPAPESVLKALEDAVKQTKNCQKGTICICFNYGGHWELADAFNKMIAAGEKDVTPEIIEKYLYTPEVPPCDLIVRTSGEERISGFQLWRAAYSEFLFLEKKFPDMSAEDVDLVLENYANRQRRFGK